MGESLFFPALPEHRGVRQCSKARSNQLPAIWGQIIHAVVCAASTGTSRVDSSPKAKACDEPEREKKVEKRPTPSPLQLFVRCVICSRVYNFILFLNPQFFHVLHPFPVPTPVTTDNQALSVCKALCLEAEEAVATTVGRYCF